MRRHKYDVNIRVRVECLHDCVALQRVCRIQPHGLYHWHVLLEEVGLNDVNHSVRLAEDEHAVLRNDVGRGILFSLDEFTLAIQ